MKIALFGSMALIFFVGCGGGSSGETTTQATPTPTTSTQKEITLNFKALVNNEEFSCAKSYTNLGSTAVSGSFSDFRFYVSDVKLIDKSGNSVALEMSDDNKWQYKNIALLDFEDNSSKCIDRGNTPATNSIIKGTIKNGEYVGVSFTLGVPQQYNHTNIDAMPSPLNSSAMNWSWQSGRKFTKIEFAPNNSVTKTDVNGTVTKSAIWNFHLGSTGCKDNNCSEPNRLTYKFDNFDINKNSIALDFGKFIKNVQLDYDGGGAVGCMSGLTDPDCLEVFKSLAVDKGYCVNECKEQSIFSIK